MLVEQIRQSAMIEEEYCMCKNKVFAVSSKSGKTSTPQTHYTVRDPWMVKWHNANDHMQDSLETKVWVITLKQASCRNIQFYYIFNNRKSCFIW